MRAKLEITNNVHEYAACCANRLGCNWLANIDFCNVISLNKEEFAHRFRTFHLIQYLNVYCLETVINLKNPGLNYCLALTIQLYNAVYVLYEVGKQKRLYDRVQPNCSKNNTQIFTTVSSIY